MSWPACLFGATLSTLDLSSVHVPFPWDTMSGPQPAHISGRSPEGQNAAVNHAVLFVPSQQSPTRGQHSIPAGRGKLHAQKQQSSAVSSARGLFRSLFIF